jgi:hypothetical protein
MVHAESSLGKLVTTSQITFYHNYKKESPKIHTEFIHCALIDVTWEWIDFRSLLDDAAVFSC